MKKFMLVLALIIGMQTYSEKSQAGLLIYGGAYVADETGHLDVPLGVMLLGTSAVSILGGLVAGGVTAIFNPQLGLKIAIIGISLDANHNFPQKNLEKFLTERYGFIDNQETIHNISQVIESEYDEGKNEIHLSEVKVQELLLAHDLTVEDYAKVLNDLQ